MGKKMRLIDFTDSKTSGGSPSVPVCGLNSTVQSKNNKLAYDKPVFLIPSPEKLALCHEFTGLFFLQKTDPKTIVI